MVAIKTNTKILKLQTTISVQICRTVDGKLQYFEFCQEVAYVCCNCGMSLQESVADISAKVWTAVSMVAHRHLVTLDRSHLLQQCSVLFAVNA